MNNKKRLILGMGRHGKDTVAEIMRDNYGISFTSSSWACAGVLKPVLDIVNGIKSKEDHFNERHLYRELWMVLIGLYNSEDKAALAKRILKDTDTYVGLRSKVEYEECIRQGVFDEVFYVDASKRVDYVDPTAEVGYDKDTMLFIDNNGSLGDLENNVRRILND